MKNMIRYCLLALVSMLVLGCAGINSAGKEIAPSGSLRMGLYKGSPSSFLTDGNLVQNRGVGFNLGKQLAKSLEIPYEPIVYESNAQVLQAIKDNQVDLVFTNATPVRAQFIQFSESFVEIEKSFLVGPKSTLNSTQEVDQPGIKVGFSAGSSSERELPVLLKRATLVKLNTTSEALSALQNGQVDAFSTNKAILFEMGDQLPGSKVLPGSIAMESIALGVPINRPDLRSLLNQFHQSLEASGELKEIVVKSGMRGVLLK